MKSRVQKKIRKMIAVLLSITILISVIQVIFFSTLTAKAAPNNCDPKATSGAIKLLEYIRSHTYISGQTDVPDAEMIYSMTGRYPAIVAFDFMDASYGRDKVTEAIEWAKKTNGIIAYQWHWRAPVGDNYNSNYAFENDLYNTNSDLYKDIDEVMRQLKIIQDAGFPVIFRPLHEANNNYMWWAKRGSDNYKKLWKLVYDRAQLHGVHNLVWCFNGMASVQSTPMSQWYPGDNMVDIVSSDYFESWNDYNICKAIGNNKVVAITETMNQLNPDNDAPWSFSVVWASRDWNENSERDWRTAMANSKTISIDQLPDLSDNGPLPTHSPCYVNLALNKTADASSAEVGVNTVDKAFDGYYLTRWSSAYEDNQWISVDLGKIYSIDRVKLNWEAAYGSSYRVQVSTDGTSWSDVYSTTAGKEGLDSISFNPVYARYIRMMGITRATEWGFSLYEFEVYESLANPIPTPTPTPPTPTPDCIKGDLNDDGSIDSTDCTLMKRLILGIIKEIPCKRGTWAADVNDDGAIDSTDYTLLKRYILRIITVFPSNAN